MVKIDNNFNKLILYDGVKLSPPSFEKDDMRIHASDFSIAKGHPLNNENSEISVSKGILIFRGVSKSVRTIYKYKNPDKYEFELPQKIVDVFSISTKKKENFGLEGVLTEPFAYVDWAIEADSFTLEIP